MSKLIIHEQTYLPETLLPFYLHPQGPAIPPIPHEFDPPPSCLTIQWQILLLGGRRERRMRDKMGVVSDVTRRGS